MCTYSISLDVWDHEVYGHVACSSTVVYVTYDRGYLIGRCNAWALSGRMKSYTHKAYCWMHGIMRNATTVNNYPYISCIHTYM